MSIILSSGYLMGKTISYRERPYPLYWWNSPDVCPVKSVNGYVPWTFFPTNSDSPSAQIDNSNNNYSGGNIGCNALEITNDLNWGYNYEEHDYYWDYMRNIIPLYDSNDEESNQYRIMVEFGYCYLLPYVDSNDPGYYWTTSQMRLTDRINQRNVISQFTDAVGVFKPDSHIYMFAGADTFYNNDSWEAGQPTGLKHNIIYSGNIIDACHENGTPRVKWAGIAFELDYIERECGVHLNRDWFTQTTT